MIELLLAAENALAAGLLDQAERTYRQVLESDPRNGIAAVGLARVALERGDEAGAIRLAHGALAIDPENATARRMVDRVEEVVRFRGDVVGSGGSVGAGGGVGPGSGGSVGAGGGVGPGSGGSVGAEGGAGPGSGGSVGAGGDAGPPPGPPPPGATPPPPPGAPPLPPAPRSHPTPARGGLLRRLLRRP